MRTISLTADPRSAAHARAFVRTTLEEIAGDGARKGRIVDADDAVLLTSELVVNVIRHVGTDLTVEVQPGPPIRIGVADGFPPTDELRALMDRPVWPAASAVSGRGFSLLHELSLRVGLDARPGGGKVVWFEI